MHLSSSIKSQVPSYIVNQYPRFVEFLEAYYEWMEDEGNPHYHIRNHLDFFTFTKTLSDYVDMFRKEYLYSFPSEVMGSKELLIKYSKQFNLSAGTQKSFEFLFNVLFGDAAGEVEIYYPRNDLFIASDGKWIDNERVMYVTANNAADGFANRVITQSREIAPGIFERASATVQRVYTRYAGKYLFNELVLSEIEGDFKLGWPITVTGSEIEDWALPTGNLTVIVDPGTNYIKGNILSFVTSDKYIKTYTASMVGQIQTELTTQFDKTELVVKVNGSVVTDFEYDGSILFHPSILASSLVEIQFPIYPGFIVIDEVNPSGEIVSARVVDSPIGISQSYLIDAEDGGTGAIVEVGPELIRRVPGYFLNTDGFASSNKYLQDNFYYQDFSYVIKTNQTLDKYEKFVKDLVHPSGYKMFGQVNIYQLINLMIQSIDLEVISIPPDISIISEVDLNSTYGLIGRLMNLYEPETFHTNNFRNVRVADVELNWMKQCNIQDFSVVQYETP